MKVADVMSTPLRTVTSGKSVNHACTLMAELRIGSLAVVDNGRIVGIITSRDVRAAHPNRIVADAMTPDPIVVADERFAWEALSVMENEGIERLIVTDKEQAVGLVTREAIVSRLAEWKDNMTELYRSPYIHAIGEERLHKRLPFQLLFLDLNRFGEVNKRYGHPVGDDLIRGYARKLKSLFGDEDYVCRYAGDEFAAITTRPDDDVREIIDSLSNPISVGPASLTASVGWLNDSTEPEFYRLSFKELVSKASLMSTRAKSG